MTLRITGCGTASRMVISSLISALVSPAIARATSTTTSTSSAPSSTAKRASVALTSVACFPLGKPATVAMTGAPTVASESQESAGAAGIMDGETHTAPHPNSRASAISASTSSRVASGLSRVASMMEATCSRVSVWELLSVTSITSFRWSYPTRRGWRGARPASKYPRSPRR